MAECGPLAVLDPARRGKVGGLGDVEAVVEARVVAIGERDHDLPLLLGDLGGGMFTIRHRDINDMFTFSSSLCIMCNIMSMTKIILRGQNITQLATYPVEWYGVLLEDLWTE